MSTSKGVPKGLSIIWRDSGDEEAYEAARIYKVFNIVRPNRYPRGIVKVKNAEDVVESIRVASEQPGDCKVAIRSGGHSSLVWSLQDNSILVDMSDWKEITVNVAMSIATVTPAVTGKELTKCLEPHGLMFQTGHHPGVAMGGFLLHGGQGWNCRSWGWSCERITAIEVVTAKGEILNCSDSANSDLFWAAKGAGPLFPAVVTRFHIQLLSLPAIRSSVYIYPAARYFEAFEWVRSVVAQADQDTEIVMVGFRSDDKQKWLKGRPPQPILEEHGKEDSMEELYRDQELANPENHYYHTDSSFLDDSADISTILETAFTTLPSKKSFAFWYPMYPRSQRTNVNDMLLHVPSDNYFSLYTIAEDINEHSHNKDWAEGVMEDVLLKTAGKYTGDSDVKTSLSLYWTEEALEKLQVIRRRWDSKSIFCSV